jgi:hypothetical protein
MPNNQQWDQPKDPMNQIDREALDKVIKKQVIDALGAPIDLREVQVRKLWPDHYRVNVIVGENAGSVRIAHSFFLVIDSNGSLISANPRITKQY